MYTVKYYGNEQVTKSAAQSLKIAAKMTKTYGQGYRAPVINADSDDEAKELVNMQMVAKTSYCVQVNGQAVC